MKALMGHPLLQLLSDYDHETYKDWLKLGKSGDGDNVTKGNANNLVPTYTKLDIKERVQNMKIFRELVTYIKVNYKWFFLYFRIKDLNRVFDSTIDDADAGLLVDLKNVLEENKGLVLNKRQTNMRNSLIAIINKYNQTLD